MNERFQRKMFFFLLYSFAEVIHVINNDKCNFILSKIWISQRIGKMVCFFIFLHESRSIFIPRNILLLISARIETKWEDELNLIVFLETSQGKNIRFTWLHLSILCSSRCLIFHSGVLFSCESFASLMINRYIWLTIKKKLTLRYKLRFVRT